MASPELEFANDPVGAVDGSGGSTGWKVTIVLGMLILTAVVWAQNAEVEQVTTGQGRVIPSSQIQVVETLEPGIVAKIEVREGDRVEKGQRLIRIDDTGAAARLGELQQRNASLEAEKLRLEAELRDDKTYEVSGNWKPDIQKFHLDQRAIFQANRKKLDDEATIRRQQLAQKEQSLEEVVATAGKTRGLLKLAQQEEELIRNLYEKKAVPEINYIRVQREAVQLAGDLEILKASQARLMAEIDEARSLIGAEKIAFLATATARLSAVNADLAVVQQTITAASDTVRRAVLRSPVNGIVNKVNVAGINEVVRAGDSIVEIVPVDDVLLVEAQIRPEDIAFIRAGLPATIRISAYDYTRYGTMEGTVQRIGADTITNEDRETFYQVIVSTEISESPEIPGTGLDIIPGMVATVDIATGNRTVLEYLLKPILVMKDRALRDPR